MNVRALVRAECALGCDHEDDGTEGHHTCLRPFAPCSSRFALHCDGDSHGARRMHHLNRFPPRPLLVTGRVDDLKLPRALVNLIVAIANNSIVAFQGWTFWTPCTLSGYPVVISKTMKGRSDFAAAAATASPSSGSHRHRRERRAD